MNEYANKTSEALKEPELQSVNCKFKQELEVNDKLIQQLISKISCIMYYDEGKQEASDVKKEPTDLVTEIRSGVSRLADQNGRLERILSHLTSIIG